MKDYTYQHYGRDAGGDIVHAGPSNDGDPVAAHAAWVRWRITSPSVAPGDGPGGRATLRKARAGARSVVRHEVVVIATRALHAEHVVPDGETERIIAEADRAKRRKREGATA